MQISEQIESYGKDMQGKLKEFKKRSFWDDSLTPEEAKEVQTRPSPLIFSPHSHNSYIQVLPIIYRVYFSQNMAEAEKFLATELEELTRKTGLCQTFDFPHLVKGSIRL